MSEKYTNCDPCIVNRKELATWKYDFVTEQVLKDVCDCLNKPICFEVLRLLKACEREKSLQILEDMKNK